MEYAIEEIKCVLLPSHIDATNIFFRKCAYSLLDCKPYEGRSDIYSIVTSTPSIIQSLLYRR